MGDIDYFKSFEDDQRLEDIDELLRNDDIFDNAPNTSSSYNLEFGVPIASGFRFRYLSEIEKKSFSGIKGERNRRPTIKVRAPSDVTLQLDLISEMSSSVIAFPHFYTLYEISKLPMNTTFIDGTCLIPVKKNCLQNIRLESLGIRKWKLKEAIPRIIEKYPQFNDVEARRFYQQHKGAVKLRAMLIQAECVVECIISKAIKSQMAKPNQVIKIQHMSPKTVADYSESLIVILKKKITSKTSTYIVFDNIQKIPLHAIEEDGRTFVFNLPINQSGIPIKGRIRMECEGYSDETFITFLPGISGINQSKNSTWESTLTEESTLMPLPESHNNNQDIEVDTAQHMEIEESGHLIQSDELISGNESCKDSGIFATDKSTVSSDYSSSDDSDYDENVIEIEGVRRRRVNRVENLDPIRFPPNQRDVSSHLPVQRTDRVAAKIFSEIARIGHDYAFGAQPSDLFKRIEKQLPVVFTLQDDVGDTPLNNAILKGNVSVAEHILEVVLAECRWALDIANTSGHTALILAPACDVPVSLVTKLLDAKCNLEAKDDLGKSAVTYAIEYQNTPVLEILLQYIQCHNLAHLLRRSETNYFSSLQIAVMNSYLEGVRLLLDLKDVDGCYMVDVNELALMNEDTALHIAVERNVELDIVKLILDRPDININLKKNGTSTALNMASKMNLGEVVTLLKNYGAEDICEEDEEIIDSADEDDEEYMDVLDQITSPSHVCNISPVVEMTPDTEQSPSNFTRLTEAMRHMSLNGGNRSRLIDILLNGDINLNVDELLLVIRPSHRTLVNRYRDNGGGDRKELAEILDRFNCLPTNLGDLLELLREIGRMDIVAKMVQHFNV